MERSGEISRSRRKQLLNIAGFVAVAAPIIFSLAIAQQSRALSQAQSTATVAPVFVYEVASIKPAKSGSRGSTMRFTPDGVTARNMSLTALFRAAYGVQPDQIVGAPSWVDSDRYDVDAKMEGSVADALQKLNQYERTIARQHMLEALLVDRFNVKIHRESKELPVYTLVIAKSGPKIQEAKTDEPTSTEPGRGGFGRGSMTMTAGGKGGARSQILTGQAVPIASLIRILTGVLERPVLDKTGLMGLYDVKLEWSPDDSETQAAPSGAPSSQTPPAPSGSGGPDLFTAIQQQLGLKLESGKGPVDIIIIDHVERPSGN